MDLVSTLRPRHAPDAAIDLEMTAVAYTDWDADSAKLGRPVVAAFGGKDGGRGWCPKKMGGKSGFGLGTGK